MNNWTCNALAKSFLPSSCRFIREVPQQTADKRLPRAPFLPGELPDPVAVGPRMRSEC